MYRLEICNEETLLILIYIGRYSTTIFRKLCFSLSVLTSCFPYLIIFLFKEEEEEKEEEKIRDRIPIKIGDKVAQTRILLQRIIFHNRDKRIISCFLCNIFIQRRRRRKRRRKRKDSRSV